MKKIIIFFIAILMMMIVSSFKIKPHRNLIDKGEPASYYATYVLDRWLEMQIKLMSSTIANFNGPFVRIYSYTSLAAYESVAASISPKSAYRLAESKINQMPPMPELHGNKKYHWPSSLNAAMASMTRAMFPSTSVESRIAIDSLERTIKKGFAKDADAATLERSAEYGVQVAQRIFAWSETDGYQHASDNYTPPSGPGTWKPTPPNFAKPVTPYWGNLRTMIAGSLDNTAPPAPIPYSEDSASAFYKEVKLVYDISQHISPVQKDIALFWKEINPGFTAPGHWMNILRQIIQKDTVPLDKAVFAYALTGMALNDAWISSWKTRYVYNLLRPVTYIRDVMKHQDWLSFVPTPPHPEYTSGFAAMGSAVCESLAYVFGEIYQFTDHTYDYAGMRPRTYNSFRALAKEAGDSKLFGGIHYRFSVEAGLAEGRAVAKNVIKILFHEANTAAGIPVAKPF
jgi:hypothetical protein